MSGFTDTERDLLAASVELGGIAETPHWVFAGLAAAIEHTGKRVGELTVDELLHLARTQAERINALLKGDPA